MTFKKAVKKDAKLRLALCGPAGSGKTYSLLSIATEIGGPIAYVDTEHGSASKYADLFQFDVIEPDVFDPRELIKTIKAAVEGGYRTVCIDSLSHYWMGKGGELEMVDNAAKRTQSGNSFTAWKNVTPVHNELVDTIIASPIHVLVSMRTKTEWVIEEDSRGKKVPRKVGLAPVMRDGIEFEFDVCGDLDQENTLTVTKSRCPDLAGKVINRPGKEVARVLKKWLAGAPSAETKPAPTPAPEQKTDTPAPQPLQPPAKKEPFKASDDDIPSNMGGNYEPPQEQNPAEKKVEEMRQRNAQPSAPANEKPWTTFKGMIACYADVKAALNAATGDDVAYYLELDLYNVKHANAFTKSADAISCYQSLQKKLAEVRKEEAA